VHQTRPEKIVTLRFNAPVDRARLDALSLGTDGAPAAKVIRHENLAAVLQVDAKSMNGIVKRAIEELDIADLKVEDAPLEEVLADMFARSRAEA
jgi:ABC-2 type transport system ATP-binding protein